MEKVDHFGFEIGWEAEQSGETTQSSIKGPLASQGDAVVIGCRARERCRSRRGSTIAIISSSENDPLSWKQRLLESCSLLLCRRGENREVLALVRERATQRPGEDALDVRSEGREAVRPSR